MNERTITPSKETIGNAGQAGFIAALVMLLAQLIWRLNWSTDNVVQAFPEFVVAAISRLTPLAIFGAATENYGSLAKKTLLLAVLLGIAAVGYEGGRYAARLTARTGTSFSGRLSAIGVVTAVFFLFTGLVILPIAYLGVFARNSSYTAEILIQLVVTFSLYALTWTALTVPALASIPIDSGRSSQSYSRREAVQRAVFNGAALAGLLAVGVGAWRLVTPKSTGVDTATSEQAVDDIVATQRARQGFETSPTPEAQAEVMDSASLTSDLALQSDGDVLGMFNDLEDQERLTPVLTATPDFYNVSKNLSDPTVDANGWTLKVTGLVEKELEFTYAELTERATVQNISTLCCISNELNGKLIGTALWTGFPLADLLAEAGIKEGAIDLKFHAADDYEDSVPVEIGLRPANLVVLGMNGETLNDKHGFPARLIIPDIFGMKNVKWLDRIEVVAEDFQGYWQTRGWSDTAVNQIWGRIDYPTKNADTGEVTATGDGCRQERGISPGSRFPSMTVSRGPTPFSNHH